jgi:hypothetical protein
MGLGTNGTNFADFWEFDQYTGTEEFSMDNFKAYPTAAVDHINFESQNLQNFEILIYNTMGQQVGAEMALDGKVRFERNQLPAGTYIYKVTRHSEVLHSDRFVFQ